MYIDKLERQTDEGHQITIVMNYDEVRDITNGLYEASKQKQFQSVYAKMSFMFDMIKFGMIQPHTADKLGCEPQFVSPTAEDENATAPADKTPQDLLEKITALSDRTVDLIATTTKCQVKMMKNCDRLEQLADQWQEKTENQDKKTEKPLK